MLKSSRLIGIKLCGNVRGVVFFDKLQNNLRMGVYSRGGARGITVYFTFYNRRTVHLNLIKILFCLGIRWIF